MLLLAEKLNQYDEIHSPTIITEDNRWSLRLKQESSNISLHLRLEPGSKKSCVASYQFGIGDVSEMMRDPQILDIYGRVIPNYQHPINASGQVLGCYIQKSKGFEIFQESRSKSSMFENFFHILTLNSVSFPDGRCDIACEITVMQNAEHAVEDSAAITKIRSDFGSMIGSESCDVVIISGREQFLAHSAVLSARSTVICTMLQINSHGRHAGKRITLKIEDIEPTVMKSFLHYIYTGEIPEKCDQAIKLLKAARRYVLPELVAICEQEAIPQISIDNVADILICSESHKALELKKNALIFVKENAKEFLKSPGYTKLKSGQHVGLMDTIVQVLADMEVIIANYKPRN